MTTQKFETSKGTLLALRLPEGAFDIEFIPPVFYYRTGMMENHAHDLVDIYGDWKEIGLWGSVSEEKAKEVVEDVQLAIMGRWYMNYADHTYTCEMATQSLKSLLETGIKLENPLGEIFNADLPAFPDSSDYEEVDQRRELWEAAESEVWKHFYLIFKKK